MITVDRDWQVYRYKEEGEWFIIHIPCYGQKSSNSLLAIERYGYPPCNNCHAKLDKLIIKKIKFMAKSTNNETD